MGGFGDRGRGGDRGGRGGRGGDRGGRGGRGGARAGVGAGAKVVVENHERFPGVYLNRGASDSIMTKNMVPGESVYNEKRVSVETKDKEETIKTEYRVWNPFRSKLGAAIVGGSENIYMKPGSKVLYLGVASGTTVSHVSDLVGPEGNVYAVEFSKRVGRDIVPIIEDARHPQKYRMLVPMVDVIFADIAQPDQARILAHNAHMFVKNRGNFVIAIKATCVDSTLAPEVVYANEVQCLREEKCRPTEQMTLEPYERDHVIVTGMYRPAPEDFPQDKN